MQAVRFLVSGHVQGVGFRASARRRAIELELTSHVRNLSDGRVEILAQGDLVNMDAFAGWLQQGPPLARVDAVQREDVVAVELTGFRLN